VTLPGREATELMELVCLCEGNKTVLGAEELRLTQCRTVVEWKEVIGRVVSEMRDTNNPHREHTIGQILRPRRRGSNSRLRSTPERTFPSKGTDSLKRVPGRTLWSMLNPFRSFDIEGLVIPSRARSCPVLLRLPNVLPRFQLDLRTWTQTGDVGLGWWS
jgi:hypothetical protein